MACGSMGPTTAGRMDPYVDLFQSHGGSMIMLAKGNRSQAVTDACKKHGGFYLGSIGGPAAILAQNNIKSIECVEYPELGMEAIWKIEVEDFPAFILVDNKGNDFFNRSNPSARPQIISRDKFLYNGGAALLKRQPRCIFTRFNSSAFPASPSREGALPPTDRYNAHSGHSDPKCPVHRESTVGTSC